MSDSAINRVLKRPFSDGTFALDEANLRPAACVSPSPPWSGSCGVPFTPTGSL